MELELITSFEEEQLTLTELKKQEPKIKNGVKIYCRDKKVAINALAHAKYKCEMRE